MGYPRAAGERREREEREAALRAEAEAEARRTLEREQRALKLQLEAEAQARLESRAPLDEVHCWGPDKGTRSVIAGRRGGCM